MMIPATWAPAILFLLFEDQPLAVQPDSWEKVQALSPGIRIELLLEEGKIVSGTLDRVSSEDVILSRKRNSMLVAKSDIDRLWALGKGSRLKNTGIAALIGFAVGCPIAAVKAGYLSDMNNPPASTRARFCLGIGGFAGGIAAGVTAPFPATRRTLVYRSPPVKR